MALQYTRDDLLHLKAQAPCLVGIDSDGCVFDSMDVKQKNHLHPLLIKLWHLEAIEPQVRAAAEFVTLHSKWRGVNRILGLLKTFEFLHSWPEAASAGAVLPDVTALRAYCESGVALGHPTIEREVSRHGDPTLRRVMEWNLAVNKDIADRMDDIPPFEGVRECLAKMGLAADLIVVSQTPEETLVNEWGRHGLDGHVRLIAGQELGTKAEHLDLARGEKYKHDQVLMIGDAPGDRKAAEAVGALFYPINPGGEVASWRRLEAEAFDRFVDGSYAGAYQDRLIGEFERLLTDVPPWQA